MIHSLADDAFETDRRVTDALITKFDALAGVWSKPAQGAAELWATFRKLDFDWGAHAVLEPSRAGDDESRALTSRLVELFESEAPPALDIGTAALLFGFARGARQGDICFDFLSAGLEPVDVVRSVLESRHFASKFLYVDQKTANQHYFVERTVSADRWTFVPYLGRLSTLADQLDQESYRALLEELGATDDSQDFQQYLAIVFTSSKTNLRDAFVNPSFDELWACRTPGEVRELLGSLPHPPSELDPVIGLLAHRFGPEPEKVVEIAEFITYVARLEGYTGAGASTRQDFEKNVGYLVEMRSPRVAEFFVEELDGVNPRRAEAYLLGAMTLAVPPLLQSGSVSARHLLASLRRLDAASHARLLESLPEEVAEELRAYIDSLPPVASLDALPPLFQSPPWTRKKKRAKPLTLALDVQAPPAEISWRDQQRETWAAYVPWRRRDAELVLDHFEGGRGNLYLLAELEDEDLFKVWNRVSFDALGRQGGFGTDTRSVVARMGLEGLPGYVKLAAARPQVTEHLGPVGAAELAPAFAKSFMGRGRARTFAQAWLERFPTHAAAGLIPDAVGKDKKARNNAEGALYYMGLQGHRETLLKVAKGYEEECGKPVEAAIQAVLEQDPFERLPKKIPKAPEWFTLSTLPPLTTKLEGADLRHDLPLSAVETITTMLAFSPLQPPYPGLQVVRELCDPIELREFAWALFETWLRCSGSAADDAGLMALAHFGDDEIARRLTPLVRKWPSEKALARAVKALDILEHIGTDIAMMSLHGISQKLKTKALKVKAAEKVDLIAEARGLTKEELGDRLVPDLGLDAKGSRILDFGPRQFTVHFDESLKPYVVDAEGQRKKSLPKPNKSDGPEAKDAVAAWKALQKDAKAVAAQELLRLERLMCDGRRITPDVFAQFFVQHPLVIHLARRLVWGWYDEQGELGALFLVAEDRTLVDADHRPVQIPPQAVVGLPHPLEVNETDKVRFGQLLGDYQLIQPFQQLGRDSFVAESEASRQSLLQRFDGIELPLSKVLGLVRNGWMHGDIAAGFVLEIWKPVEPGVRVVFTLEPGFSADGAEAPGTGVQSLRLKPVEASAVGVVRFSELVRELTIAAS